MGAIPYVAILAELTSDDVLDTAYDWLCRRRRAYPADADVWSFRQAWAQEKDKLKAALAAGRFRFGLLTRITLKDGEEIDLWSARDALVLRALAIVLAQAPAGLTPLHPRQRPWWGQGGSAPGDATPTLRWCVREPAPQRARRKGVELTIIVNK